MNRPIQHAERPNKKTKGKQVTVNAKKATTGMTQPAPTEPKPIEQTHAESSATEAVASATEAVSAPTEAVSAPTEAVDTPTEAVDVPTEAASVEPVGDNPPPVAEVDALFEPKQDEGPQPSTIADLPVQTNEDRQAEEKAAAEKAAALAAQFRKSRGIAAPVAPGKIEGKTFIKFQSRQPEPARFDIKLDSKNIFRSAYAEDTDYLTWKVPVGFIERVRRHHFVVSGRLVEIG